jgi:predicted metalloendopeptidase
MCREKVTDGVLRVALLTGWTFSSRVSGYWSAMNFTPFYSVFGVKEGHAVYLSEKERITDLVEIVH